MSSLRSLKNILFGAVHSPSTAALIALCMGTPFSASAAGKVVSYQDGNIIVVSNVGRRAQRTIFDTAMAEDGSLKITLRPSAFPHPPRAGSRRPRKVPEEYAALIEEACHAHQLPIALVTAVMATESAFDPNALSSAGAQGLMQLMPKTAESLGITNAFDPKENIFGGVRYLKALHAMFNNDTRLAVAAYNAGPTAVTKAKGVPNYPETRAYVARVMELFEHYKAQRTY